MDDDEDPWQKPTSDAIDKARNARKTPTATFLGHVKNRNNPFDSSSNDDSTPEESVESDVIDLIEKIKETTVSSSDDLNSIRNRPSLIDADSEDVEESVDESEQAKKGPTEAIAAASFFSPHIVTLTESVEDIVLRKRQSKDPQNQNVITEKPVDIERVQHAAVHATQDSVQREIVHVEEEQVSSPVHLSWFFPSKKSAKVENARPPKVPLTAETPPAHLHQVQRQARDPPIDKKKVPSNPYYAARFHVPSDPSERSVQEIENLRSQSLTPSAMVAVSPLSETVSETARPESAPPIASSISISRIGHSFVSDEEPNLPPTEDLYYEGRSETMRRRSTRDRATTSKSPEKYKYMTQTPSYDDAYDDGVDASQEKHEERLVSQRVSRQGKGDSKHGDNNHENYTKKQSKNSHYSEWDYHDKAPEDQPERSMSRRKPRSNSNHEVYTNQSQEEEHHRNFPGQKAASNINDVNHARGSFDKDSYEDGLYRQQSEGSGPRRSSPVPTSYEEEIYPISYEDEYEDPPPKIKNDRGSSRGKSQRDRGREIYEAHGNTSYDQDNHDISQHCSSHKQNEYIQRGAGNTSKQKSRSESHHALNQRNSHDENRYDDYFRTRSRKNNSSSWDDQDDKFDARLAEQPQRKNVSEKEASQSHRSGENYDHRLRSESKDQSSRRSKSATKRRKSESHEEKSKRSQSARKFRGKSEEDETVEKHAFDEIYVQRHDLVTGDKHGQSAHSRSQNKRKSTLLRSRTGQEEQHSNSRDLSQNQVQHTSSRDLSRTKLHPSGGRDVGMSCDTPASNDDDYNTEISSALVEWSPPKESPPKTKASKIKRRQPSPERLMRTRMVVVDHGPKSPPEPQPVFFQPSSNAGTTTRNKEKNKKKSNGLSVETSHPSSFSTAIVPHVGSDVVAVPKAKQPIPVTRGHSTDLVAIQKTIQDGQMVILSEVQGMLVKDPYGDEGRYTGIMLDGLPHGEGTMHYSDGRSYTGKWRNGRWHGQGRAKFVNGDVFTGKYERDRRHGKGRYEWSDGRVYDGEFVRNQRHGHGAYTWPDGASYIGEFVDGQRHGEGCYRFADGSVYKGEWQNGKYDGIGECVWASGRKYHGEWRAGKAQGYGVEFRSNGTIRHQGEWKKDRPVRKREDP